MLDDELAKDILDSIEQVGESSIESARSKNLINSNKSHVVSITSGSPRIQSNVLNRFKLILAIPPFLTKLYNPSEIKCAVCNNRISFPCWYYSVHYVVNAIHYFICFDRFSPDKPSTRCHRKGE